MLANLVLILHVMVAFTIVVLVLLQHGKGADMGGRLRQWFGGQPVRRIGRGKFPFAFDGRMRGGVFRDLPGADLLSRAQGGNGRDEWWRNGGRTCQPEWVSTRCIVPSRASM